MGSSMANVPPFHQNLQKNAEQFLHNSAIKQTNKQSERITFCNTVRQEKSLVKSYDYTFDIFLTLILVSTEPLAI